MVILIVIITGFVRFAADISTIYAVWVQIPNATSTIENAVRSCIGPYPIGGTVTYEGKSINATIELKNLNLNEEIETTANGGGQWLVETANWGWPGGGTKVDIKACYSNICETKQIIMQCSKGADQVDFYLG